MKQKEYIQEKRKKTAVQTDKDLMAIAYSKAAKAAPTAVKVVKGQEDSAEKAFRKAEKPYAGRRHVKKKAKKRKAKKGKR